MGTVVSASPRTGKLLKTPKGCWIWDLTVPQKLLFLFSTQFFEFTWISSYVLIEFYLFTLMSRKKMDRGRCHVRKWIEGAVVGVCFSRFSLLAVISYGLFSTVCQISSRAFYMGELGNYMTSSGTLTKKTPVSLRKFEFNFMKRKEQK